MNVNDELGRAWNEAVVSYFKLLSEGLRKITATFSKDSRPPEKDKKGEVVLVFN